MCRGLPQERSAAGKLVGELVRIEIVAAVDDDVPHRCPFVVGAHQLQAHADAQAANAQNLMEKARGVKGGNKLTGALTRLHDDAKTQAMEAGEIHKRAVRSADACAALLANVTTRYADMYKAVIDSPETAPAELAYYQGN